MGLEGLALIIAAAGLWAFVKVQEWIRNFTGLEDGSKGLTFATIGFFIGAWLLFLAGLVIFTA